MSENTAIMEVSDLVVANWLENSDETPAQVHILFQLWAIDAQFVLRLKSREACNELIDALIKHRDEVFGAEDTSMRDMESLRANETHGWYFAIDVDDFPQFVEHRNTNGYIGPFETEFKAWQSYMEQRQLAEMGLRSVTARLHERLGEEKQQRNKLREALRPFAEAAEFFSDMHRTNENNTLSIFEDVRNGKMHPKDFLRLKHFRRAAAAFADSDK